MSYSPLIDQLINALRCLPGVGAKSAQRMAFKLLERDRQGGQLLSQALAAAMAEVGHCQQCRILTEQPVCRICASQSRDPLSSRSGRWGFRSVESRMECL